MNMLSSIKSIIFLLGIHGVPLRIAAENVGGKFPFTASDIVTALLHLYQKIVVVVVFCFKFTYRELTCYTGPDAKHQPVTSRV